MPQKDLLVHEQLEKSAAKFPEKAAIILKRDNGTWQTLTYKETGILTKKAGAFIIKKGLKHKDFALLISENRPEWGITYFGMMYAGVICVPLDPQLSVSEIDNVINDCQAKAVFVSGKSLDKISQKTRDKLKIIVIDDNYLEGLKSVSLEGISWPAVSTQDMASLIYTSGTTGQPKGVMLSHLNFCSNVDSCDKMHICLLSDNMLCILPLFHTYAFTVTLLLALFVGTTTVYLETINSETLIHGMKEANITLLIGVPQLYNLIHKAIFDKLKKVPPFIQVILTPLIKAKMKKTFGKGLRLSVSGGAKLNPKVAADLTRLGFRLIEGYGITEAAPTVSFNPMEKVKFGSVGPPLPGVCVKIDKPDKDGVGEVLVRGDNIMRGYYKHPEKTEAAVKEGWLYTGDLGYLDKDGYLFLTGRAKDIIVLSSGKNIYPDELEERYQSPYIKEICITFRKDDTQESLFAVVVPNFDYFRLKNEINIQYKIRWELDTCASNLPSYQHITGFVVAKEPLPRTRLGKLKRHIIQEKYLKSAPVEQEKKEEVFSEEDLKVVNPDTARKIIDYLSAEFKKRVRLDSHIEIDLGIDSLMRVQLEAGLEQVLKVKIPPAFSAKVYTVKELVIKAQELLGSQDGRQLAAQPQERKSWSQILRQAPDGEILKSIKLNFTIWDRVFLWTVKMILLIIFKIFWRLRAEGVRSLPSKGPFILCPNHSSYLDGFAIQLSIPFETAISSYSLGHTEIFKHPMVRWAVKIARLILIDPTLHLTEALQTSAYVLSKGKIVCIFPEGGRAMGEKKVDEFKKGIGILVKEFKEYPIVPVYIAGSYHAWPRNRSLPRPYPLKVIFGKPLDARRLGEDVETITKKLREEVIKLIPKT
jgi:long-chain acyl-CoA synthetase